MRTTVTRTGWIAAASVAAVLAAPTDVPAASAQPADTELRIDGSASAPQGVTVKADATSGKTVRWAGRLGIAGWLELHRPDGGIVHVKVDQIVFVMSAAWTGANERARSRLQLANGFADVRESVDEVMEAIQNDHSLAKYGV